MSALRMARRRLRVPAGLTVPHVAQGAAIVGTHINGSDKSIRLNAGGHIRGPVNIGAGWTVRA